jgi:membrane associated rhomboid family serine protease
MNPTNRLGSFLPPGVREPLAATLVTGIVARAGADLRVFNLYPPFALWPGAFWRGSVWQAATYAWLPLGPADWIFNGFFFAMLGTRLVQVWGRRPFWWFCFAAVLGTAMVKLALTPLNRAPLAGIGGVIFAMLAAWYRLFAHEEVMLMTAWRMRMRAAVLTIGGLNIVFGLLSPCGFWNALAILIGGSATGWLYLTAQSRRAMSRRARRLPEERISRLEL